MTEQQLASYDNRTVQLDAARLVALRRARGLSREQLAESARGAHQLSVATIKRAESGAAVYLETARRIAGLLEVGVDSLLASADDAPATERTPMFGGEPLAVAVLPFTVVGSDPKAAALAHGVVEDLTTRLGDFWFPVMSHASFLEYRAPTVSTQLRDELGVGYCVTGSVQLRGEALRIQARLLLAENGKQLWAGEYNRPYADLFALQDELTSSIVDSVNHRLLELESTRGSDLGSLAAWEHAMRGHRLFLSRSATANAAARGHFEQVLTEEPQSGFAWCLLALTHQQDLLHQWASEPRATLTKLDEVSREFARRAPRDARANLVRAYALLYRGQREEAEDRLRAAVVAAPNLSGAYSLLGQTLAMAGRADEALEQLEIALRLNPIDSGRWSIEIAVALAHLVAERYEEARYWAERATRLEPRVAFAYGTLAASSLLAGDSAAARVALARMVELHPGFSSDSFALLAASTAPSIVERYLRALKVAGLPG